MNAPERAEIRLSLSLEDGRGHPCTIIVNRFLLEPASRQSLATIFESAITYVLGEGLAYGADGEVVRQVPA